MSDTVAMKRHPFSVDEQAADLRRYTSEPREVLNYTLGAIEAFAREGGVFNETADADRLAYIRNALAAAELVRAELDAR